MSEFVNFVGQAKAPRGSLNMGEAAATRTGSVFTIKSSARSKYVDVVHCQTYARRDRQSSFIFSVEMAQEGVGMGDMEKCARALHAGPGFFLETRRRRSCRGPGVAATISNDERLRPGVLCTHPATRREAPAPETARGARGDSSGQPWRRNYDGFTPRSAPTTPCKI